jgi:fructose-specific phosphotransferase system IIA component
MKLLDYIDESLIHLGLEGRSKSEILSRLVELLASGGIIREKDALLESLIEREGLGSTGIGHGVAIPHSRSREVERPAIAFGRSLQEVDFDSIDGQPTRIFFLLIAPENGSNDHLHLLARIARLMRDAPTREKLLQMETSAEVIELLGRFDAR